MEQFLSMDFSYVVLAYLGMIIHIFMKLAELQKTKKYNIISYVKDNSYSFVASILCIPVIIYVAHDPFVNEFLPINRLTAVFAGYQTQSLFRTLMNIANKKTKN